MVLDEGRKRIDSVFPRHYRLMYNNIIQSWALMASLMSILVGSIGSKFGFINNMNLVWMLFAFTFPLTIYVITTAIKIESTLSEHTENQTVHTNHVKKICNGMSDLVKDHSEKKVYLEVFTELYGIYCNIPSQKGLTKFKDKYVYDVKKKLNELSNEQSITYMKPEDSFELLIETLNNLQKDDKVIAVSFMNEGEFETDNPIWNRYIDAQKTAAHRGATVERIFIVSENKFRDLLKKDIVKIHTEGQSKVENINGYLIDQYYYDTHISRERKDLIDDGFILINSNSTQEVMAVIDHFSVRDPNYLDYRTTVTFNIDILNSMNTDFDYVKSLSTRLTKENLKSKFNIDYEL